MTTRKWSMVILAVATCFAWMGCRPASPASVEDQESDPPKLAQMKLDEDTLRVQLLETKLVQKDLRLTTEQTKNLRSLYETHTARARELYEKLTEIDFSSCSEEESERFHTLLEDLTSMQKKCRAKCLAILTPDQTERLKQIRLQTTIPEALQSPEIAKALHLSEEQLEKIHTLRDQMNQKWESEWLNLSSQMQPLRPQRLPKNLPDLNTPDEKANMIEFRKSSLKDAAETTNRILDLLTPEQRIELEKLTGKKIDLTQLYDEWIKSAKSYFDSGNPETVPNPFY